MIHINNLWHIRPVKFSEKDGKRINALTIILYENNFFDCDLNRRIPDRFYFKANNTNVKILSVLAHQVSVTRNHMHCLAIKSLYTKKNKSIEPMTDELEPVVSEKKVRF